MFDEHFILRRYFIVNKNYLTFHNVFEIFKIYFFSWTQTSLSYNKIINSLVPLNKKKVNGIK